jgi:hypothetical protein
VESEEEEEWKREKSLDSDLCLGNWRDCTRYLFFFDAIGFPYSFFLYNLALFPALSYS